MIRSTLYLIVLQLILGSCTTLKKGIQQPVNETIPVMTTTPLTYLALGDSYTIGEAVPLRESFPYQFVQLARNKGRYLAAPEIIATTGWTTDELAAAIQQYAFLPRYDLVTLLIGVNNQYRGRSLEQYRTEFAGLLQKAILFADNKKQRVAVVSIPDYGVTPYAKDRNPEKIGKELDAFNAAAKEICAQNGITFIDITEDFRKAAQQPDLVAVDGLHPSGKAYRQWAQKLVTWLENIP